jgi:APA family basic amino acid/polyamine antiporter
MALTAAAYAVPGALRPTAAVVVVALTLVNLGGVSRTATATRLMLAGVLVVLALVVVATLAGGRADPGHLGSLTSGGLGGTLEAAGLLFFAFAGYARIATLGEEVVDPQRTIPRAIPLALGIALAIYVVVLTSALLAAGPDRLAGAPDPLAVAVRLGDLSELAPIVRVGGALAATGVLLSLLAGVGRTAFAMGSNGDLPRWLAAVHPRHRVPHRAEAAVGSVVAVGVLLVDLREAIGFSSFTVLTYYAVANASSWTLRPEQRRWPRWLSVLGLAGCLLLAFALPLASVVGGLAVLAIGGAVWGARRRLRRSGGARLGAGGVSGPRSAGVGRPRRRPLRKRSAGSGLVLFALLSLAGAVLLDVLWAGPADAHAVLVSASPSPGSLLDQAPSRVVVTFNEPVGIEGDALTVIDATGSVVSTRPVAEGASVSVELQGARAGWHAASWRVVSADGHPLSGAWTFRIGDGSATAPAGLQERAADAAAADPWARNLWIAGQYASALGSVVLAGTLFLAVAGIRSDLRGRAGATAWLALGSALASALAAAANGPYSVGGAVTDDLFAGPASAAFVWRAVLLVAVAGALVVLGTQRRAPAAGIWLAALAALVLVPMLSGHAPTDGWVARVAVGVHLVVAACWLGAIPALLLSLRDSHGRARAVLGTFSWLAARLLVATLVVGALAALVLSGGPSEVNPRWGWLLVAKLALAGVAIVAGALNRRELRSGHTDRAHVPHPDGDRPPVLVAAEPGGAASSRPVSAGGGRRTSEEGNHEVLPPAGGSSGGWPMGPLVVEAVALLGIVGLSVAMTHNGPPSEPDRGPAAVDLVVADDLRAQLVVDPAQAGPNWVHLYVLDAAGRPRPVESVSLTFASPERAIEPVDQRLSDAGNGHYLSITNDLGLPGTWEVHVGVRVDRFTEESADASITIAP